MRLAHVALALFAAAGIAGCGDDDGGGGGNNGAPPPPPPPAPAAGTASQLVPQKHIEDFAASAAEKSSIRRSFQEADFSTDTSRDPFYSYVIPLAGTQTTITTPQQNVQPTAQCKIVVAPTYSWGDLHLVGIEAAGTQRTVLMMDPGNYGNFIKAGECVGKEKAYVREITEQNICFTVYPENGNPEEHCVNLHANELPLTQSSFQIPTETKSDVTPVLPPGSPGTIRPTAPAPSSSPTQTTAPTTPAPAPASVRPTTPAPK